MLESWYIFSIRLLPGFSLMSDDARLSALTNFVSDTYCATKAFKI
jgi:hypothetical protein